MRIGIAFSLKPADAGGDGPDDRFEEFDKPETVEAIAQVIRGEGHDVVLLGDGREFLEKMLADPPDFVFNFAEGHGVGRSREARVPAVCEMLGIPYSGSDPLTLAATLDKTIAKRLLGLGLHTRHPMANPRGVTPLLGMPPSMIPSLVQHLLESLHLEWGFEADPGQSPKLILKPAYEGSSKGIRGKCIAETADEAAQIYERLSRDYQQPVLIEEFIHGDEITVGVIGNARNREVIGIMRVVPREPTTQFVYSLEVKRDWANRVHYETPAQLPDEVREQVEQAATTVFACLECRDVARIDFRLRNGIPYFIEANPLPGLSPGTSDLVILAQGYGISHEELIRRILHAALDRVGLGSSGSRGS